MPDEADPIYRAEVEMVDHAQDPDVPEDAELTHAEQTDADPADELADGQPTA